MIEDCRLGFVASRGWIVLGVFLLALARLAEPATAAQGQQGEAIAVQADKDVSASSELAGAVWLRIALLIGLPGILGGLLFGMKGTSLSLPYTRRDHRWAPGFLADCLYGLAGGIVIFLVMPGQFQFSLDAGPLEVLKIVGLAIVGGYGGRSLVEKVLADQIEKLQDKVDKQERQTESDARATDLVNKQLDDNVESSPISSDELVKAVANGSVTARQAIFEKVRRFRQEAFQEGRRDLLPRGVPILEGLIKADVEEQYHRNHGQLGYTLKDREPPDWAGAEAQFTKAIEIRDRLKVGGYGIYEYSRAKCRINQGAEVEKIRADLEKALNSQLSADRLRKRDKYDQDVERWLADNRDELGDWLAEHQIPV